MWTINQATNTLKLISKFPTNHLPFNDTKQACIFLCVKYIPFNHKEKRKIY